MSFAIKHVEAKKNRGSVYELPGMDACLGRMLGNDLSYATLWLGKGPRWVNPGWLAGFEKCY